jgi:hypothetical protein
MNNWAMRLVLTGILLITILSFAFKIRAQNTDVTWWDFQSVDTMKFSRDLAREKNRDVSYDTEIARQVKNIAETGATHVAIATPYDEEFLPFLKRWVRAARNNNLNIWFRGNWSGWEKWFDYESISRNQHMQKTKEFILNNRDLFEDGDVFTACPECENGGPGDPRHNGDLTGHRQFLIDEYIVTKSAFTQIGKKVESNYNSMNGDVANLVMDKQTTALLDGLVVVDHYVKTPEQLAADIKKYALQSGGKVILGEFGAPIPDIHGQMSEVQQAEWLKQAMRLLSQTPELAGLNYWTNQGSSTQLWTNTGNPKPALESLKKYYAPTLVNINVKNEAGLRIENAIIHYANRQFGSGNITFPVVEGFDQVNISANGYLSSNTTISEGDMDVILVKIQESWLFKLQKLLIQLINRIIP